MQLPLKPLPVCAILQGPQRRGPRPQSAAPGLSGVLGALRTAFLPHPVSP